MMNIMVIATTPFSMGRGSHMRILGETIALAKAGHHVEILTYPLGDDPVVGKEYTINISRIPNVLPWYTKTSAGSSWGKIVFDSMLFFILLCRSMENNPDIIWAHNYEAVVIGYVVQKMLFWRNIKLVGDMQGSLVAEMTVYDDIQSNSLKKIARVCEKIIHTMPDQIFASSRALAVYISPDRKTACEVLYDAASVPCTTLSRKELRKKYHIKDDAFVMLYTGGFTKDKGIETMFTLIRETSQESILWVIAGGPLSEIEIPADISSCVILVSPMDTQTLQELLSLADCAIDPKERTSLQASGKIINYMQYGLPMVCFDDTVSRDYMGDEIADICTGTSVGAIQEKIKYLQNNKDTMVSLREKIHKRAALFSWDDIIEKI
jgi:glycosyltransferase involved in cell wall biosynthesis